jgi:hypothetical protein
MERKNNITEGQVITPPLSPTSQPTEPGISTVNYVKNIADAVEQVKLQEPLKVPKSDEDVEDVEEYNINVVKYNKIQEHKNLADEQSDEHEKDILMVTMPVGAVVSKSIWEFSRVTFMVIIIITLLMILLVLYVTDVPVILIPSY